MTLPAAERRAAGLARLDGLRTAMAAADVELTVVYGSGRYELARSNWCRYYSGVKSIGRDSCVLLPREGPAVLVVTPGWDATRPRTQSWIDEVVAADSLVDAVAREVVRHDWAGVRTAFIDLERARAPTAQHLRALFSRVAVTALPLPRTQDGLGLASIAKAVAIAEAGYERLRAVLAPGARDYELAAEVEEAMRAGGAEANFLIICASQHHLGPTPPCGRVIAEGDVVLAEISPGFDGQFAQICRTLVVGEPPPALVRNHDILDEAFEASFALCRAGATVADVTRAANEVLAGHGFAHYNGPRYMRTRGHAVGLGPMVPTMIAEDSDLVLETGMAFVLHPNQYFPDSGYVMYGEHLVVGEQGASLLPRRRAALDGGGARAHA